jgi:hypothetical protein
MAVETFVDFMNGGSLLGTLAGIAIAVCLLPLVVLIHEAGHALAALAVGHRVTEVVVGDDPPLLTVSGNGPDDWSDGVWVRGAWRAMRRPAGWADPHETTSVAPPG